jgi:hypothetical protein
MLDFRRMPLQLNAEANKELLTWSDDVVAKFLQGYFPELDRFTQFKDLLDELKGRF